MPRADRAVLHCRAFSLGACPLGLIGDGGVCAHRERTVRACRSHGAEIQARVPPDWWRKCHDSWSLRDWEALRYAGREQFPQVVLAPWSSGACARTDGGRTRPSWMARLIASAAIRERAAPAPWSSGTCALSLVEDMPRLSWPLLPRASAAVLGETVHAGRFFRGRTRAHPRPLRCAHVTIHRGRCWPPRVRQSGGKTVAVLARHNPALALCCWWRRAAEAAAMRLVNSATQATELVDRMPRLPPRGGARATEGFVS